MFKGLSGALRGLSGACRGGSPPTEVQDGVGREHAQDDEGAGHGHSHVVGGVGQKHVRVHRSSKGQEAADT